MGDLPGGEQHGGWRTW